jgi:hypothetical protein
VLVFARIPRRQDVAGLAAACAAVLAAVTICAGYFSVTYVLWLAPLVLVVLELAAVERTAAGSTRESHVAPTTRQPITVSSRGVPVSTS